MPSSPKDSKNTSQDPWEDEKNNLKLLIANLPPLDIYRTPPLERNISKCGCLTLRMRSNIDTRTYLILQSSLSIVDIPKTSIADLPKLELWKSNTDPKEAMFYFNRLYDTSSYQEIKQIIDKGWLVTRNRMGWDWSKYRNYKEREARWAAMTKEEKEQKAIEFQKTLQTMRD